jgi:hypothetical protein
LETTSRILPYISRELYLPASCCGTAKRGERPGLVAREPLQDPADDGDVVGAAAAAVVAGAWSPNVEVAEDLPLGPPWPGQEAADREAPTLGAAPARRPT